MKIYTDASSRFISGVSFIATTSKNKEIIRKSSIANTSDNNTAELAAIVMALKYAEQCNEPVIILTDSAYAINAIRNGYYRPQEKSLMKELERITKKVKCHFMWIKGHVRDVNVLSHFNNMVDREANLVRVHYENLLFATKSLFIDK